TPLAGGAIALRAATDRELRVSIASPTGGGELWHADWRWWSGRQRVAVGLDAPAPFGGTWGVAAVAELETFGAPTSTAREERRKQLAFTAGDWLTPTLAWEGRVALDRWSSGRSAGLAGGL